MRDDHLGVVGGDDVHRPRADRLHLAVGAVDLDPVAGLVGVLDDRHDARDQAADIVLEREGERQAHGRDQGDDVLEGGLDQNRNDDRDAGDADQQPGDGRDPQDHQPPVRGRALGGAAHDPAHRQDEQTAADQNDEDEKNMAPGQFPQEAQSVARS